MDYHHEDPEFELVDYPEDVKGYVSTIRGYVPGSEEERRLLRKLDSRIIPCCWILYLLGYLDRANIGNAKTGGLEKDFQLTSTQYSVVLLVFFVSYVLFEIPSNLILTRVRPSLYLPGLAVAWGAIAAVMAATQNWRQLAAVRFALGVVEAGFAPGIAFYLSSWYRRYEVAGRYGYYYTAVSCAGMVSGLLAGLITQHLDGALGIAGWRWLFIIEGTASSAFGLVTWFFMADYPANTRWLSDDERFLAQLRIAYDGIGSTQGTDDEISAWSAITMTVRDWKTWVLGVLYALVTGSQTMQYFIPTLVGQLGWTGWQGQYHSIPPYAFGFVCTLVFTAVSDYYKNKPFFISLFAAIDTVFFIIVSLTTNHTVRYICTIFAFGPIFGLSPLILNWVSNTIDSPSEKRAVAIALVNGMGNLASIYGVFLWPKHDAPRYTVSFSVTTTWIGCIALAAPFAGILFKRHKQERAVRDGVQGDAF